MENLGECPGLLFAFGRSFGSGSIGGDIDRSRGINSLLRLDGFFRGFLGSLFRRCFFRGFFRGFLGWGGLVCSGLFDDRLLNDAAEFRLLFFALQIIGAAAAFDDFV